MPTQWTRRKKAKCSKDYLNITIETNAEYRKVAFETLLNQFLSVSQMSLRTIFAHFNYHYAPTVEIVEKALEGVGTKIQGKDIWISLNRGDHPNKIVNLKLLQRKRSERVKSGEPNKNLKGEIEWTKTYLCGLKKKNEILIKSKEKIKVTTRPRKKIMAECAVCCDEFLIKSLYQCVDSHHQFCAECLQNQVKECIYGQSSSRLFCMQVGCKSFFSWNTLERVLNPKLLKKLDERYFEEDLNSAKIDNLIRCKYCNYAAIVDEPVDVNKVFKCGNPGCLQEVCRICDLDWNEEHFGIPCDEMEKDDEVQFRKETEEKMAESVIRQCHKCKAQLIKEAGCNKLTCQCGAKICYVCRQPDVCYNHFCTHFRLPRQPCKHCEKCNLWENTTTIDNENVMKIKTEAEKTLQGTLGGKIRKIGVDLIESQNNSQH